MGRTPYFLLFCIFLKRLSEFFSATHILGTVWGSVSYTRACGQEEVEPPDLF